MLRFCISILLVTASDPVLASGIGLSLRHCAVSPGGSNLATLDEYKSTYASTLRSDKGHSFVRVDLVSPEQFAGRSSFSVPAGRVSHLSNHVERLHVHTDSTGKPISISSSFEKAIGVGLFNTALLSVSPPVELNGPVISVKDAAPVNAPKQSPDEAEPEEPSFLRKYWWIVVGAMLISSMMGGKETAPEGGSTSNSN